MRGHSRVGIWAATATIAIGAAGCASTGRPSPAAAPSPAPAFTAAMSPGFSPQPSWSADVPWAMGFTSSGVKIAPDLGLMVMQAEAGFIQTVGSSISVVSFAGGPGSSSHSTSVQFRSAATGAPLATVNLPYGSFDGLFADTADGQPVAVAHYGSSTPATTAGGGAETKIASAYAADGSLVWTSQGRAIASGAADSSGLVTFSNGFPIYVGGYTVRYNGSPDPGARSFDVLDPTGTVALHIPGAGANGEQVHVSLAGGYALVSSTSQGQAAGGSASGISMSAYDLGHGAAKVGQWTEPAASGPGRQGDLLAATGGRLLVAWPAPAPGAGSKAATSLAVLDAAAGTASTVSGVPSDAAPAAALGAFWDSSTGSLTIYDQDTTQAGPAFAVNLSSGAVAWSQPSGQGSLQPISCHDGAMYAVELGTASVPASMVTIRESDGAVTARGYQIAPVAFTDHGAAVFAQSTSPTTLTTARIGVSATSGAGR